MRKEIGLSVPYRKINTGPLSKADIETLALTMEYMRYPVVLHLTLWNNSRRAIV